MESVFPRYDELVSKATWNPRPNYVDAGTELCYVITDSDLDKSVAFVASAKIDFLRRWGWSRNCYVKRKDKTEVEFPKSADYRGVDVFSNSEEQLAALTNSKGNDGRRLRLTNLDKPEKYREIEIPKTYKLVDVLLPQKGPLQVLVEDKEKKRHLMVWIGADQSASWTGEGAKAFVLRNLPVLFNPRALKPDEVLNKIGLVAIFMIFLGFVLLRKS